MRHTPISRVSLVMLLALLPLAQRAEPACASESCLTTSVGIDTSQADGIAGIVVYGSIAQSFVAVDTLVTSFTIWRAPGGFGIHPISPRFFETDSLGRPTSTVVWEGPSLSFPQSIDAPMPYTWSIDPPLALPRAGRYAWSVCSYDFDLLAMKSADVYSEGHAFDRCRRFCGSWCGVDPSTKDLVFQMTFCRDQTTPTRRHRWGELKSIYR